MEGIVGALKWLLVLIIAAGVISAVVAGKRGKGVKKKGALRIIAGDSGQETEKLDEPGGKNKKSSFKYDPDEAWPFVAKEVMTGTEQKIYRKLKRALPEFEIMAQVQLSQILGVKKGHNFYKWFNRINRMSIDFVVLNSDLKAVAAIEIDDSTHRDPKRMEADAKKNKAIKSAGITILRWEPETVPDSKVIAQYFVSKSERLP